MWSNSVINIFLIDFCHCVWIQGLRIFENNWNSAIVVDATRSRKPFLNRTIHFLSARWIGNPATPVIVVKAFAPLLSLSFSLFFSSARIAKVTHMLAVVPVCDHSQANNWTRSLSAIFLNIDLSMFPKTNNHCHLLLFRCCIVFMLLFTSTSQTLLFQVKI